ncbi:hypothetical protein ACRAWF_46300 [Streptomyces sp. L7]
MDDPQPTRFSGGWLCDSSTMIGEPLPSSWTCVVSRSRTAGAGAASAPPASLDPEPTVYALVAQVVEQSEM